MRSAFNASMFVCALVSICLASSTARSSVWDEDTRMTMVRVLVGEAGFRPVADHPAIIGVLMNRNKLPAWRGRPIIDVARAYSAVVRDGLPVNENRLRAASLDRDTAPRWVVSLVDSIGDGNPLSPCRGPWSADVICDPCRREAMHWGSHQDAYRTRLRRVDCGRTRNVFLGAPISNAGFRGTFVPGSVLPAKDAY